MGRAINQDNRLDNHERRIKMLENAMTELLEKSTSTRHVDLDEEMAKHEKSIREENNKVKRTRKKKIAEVE